jgi:hypothetical protein
MLMSNKLGLLLLFYLARKDEMGLQYDTRLTHNQNLYLAKKMLVPGTKLQVLILNGTFLQWKNFRSLAVPL